MQINPHVRIHTHGPRDRSITRPTAHHAGFTFFLSPGERLPYHRVQTTSSTTRGATINIPKKRTTRAEDRADGAPIDRSLGGALLCDASVERVRSFVRSFVGCFFCVCLSSARAARRERSVASGTSASSIHRPTASSGKNASRAHRRARDDGRGRGEDARRRGRDGANDSYR